MSKTTVFLLYGFAEGPKLSKKFKQELLEEGFLLATTAAKADVVIAHSGGCFYLPEGSPGQLTILIDPPFWPGKFAIVSMVQKMWRDLQAHWQQSALGTWLEKTVWSGFYIIRDIRRAIWLILNARKHNLLMGLDGKNVVIVRNKNDAWLTPEVPELLKGQFTFRYHELPGQHDDCWLNPKLYIQIIQSSLKH